MLRIPHEEIDRLSSSVSAAEFGNDRNITSDQLARGIERGKQLRAEAMARFLRQFAATLVRMVRRMVRMAPLESGCADDARCLEH